MSRRIKTTIALILMVVCAVVSTSGCRVKLDESYETTMESAGVSTDKDDDENEEVQSDIPADAVGFSDLYSHVPGVFNFRGGNMRTAPTYGEARIKKGTLKQVWKNLLPAGASIWGGGAGWTGQPALVQWPEETRKAMNIKKKFKKQEDFVEIIQGSLNGKIYFFDLETGEATRDPIDLGNPIKGSVSIDPRGYPLMVVGQGIDETGKVGFYIINLINQEPLYFQTSYDEAAPRKWAGNDSSALFDKDSDTVYMCSENGLVYRIKLNTEYNPEEKSLSIEPKIKKYNTGTTSEKFRSKNGLEGIENSPAAYDNLLYFVDNGGVVRCITTDFEEKWMYKTLDDADASCIIEVEDGVPMVYTGCEIDKQGGKGISRFVKLNGLTGKVVWKREFECYNKDGASPSNGGLLGSPVLGKNSISDRIIFSLCRYPDFDSGALMALDKATGKTIWEKELTTYCWPSPVDIYDSITGKAYILQNDHDGTVRLFNGKNGKEVFSEKVDWYLEASPAVFNDKIVFTARSGYMYRFDIK